MRGIFRSLGEGEVRADGTVVPASESNVNTADATTVDASTSSTRTAVPSETTSEDVSTITTSTPVSASRPTEVTSEAVSTIRAPADTLTPILLTKTPDAPAVVTTDAPSDSSSGTMVLVALAGLALVAGGVYYFGKKK